MSGWGRQKDFDRDADGHLSSSEWREWYVNSGLAEEEACAGITLTLPQSDTPPAALYQTACECAKALLPRWGTAEKQLTGCALLYNATTALAQGGRLTDEGKVLLRTLCRQSGACSDAEVRRSIQTRQPLFQTEGMLTYGQCGTFWQQIIEVLPPCDEPYPEALAQLVQCAAEAFACMGGEEAAPARRSDLQSALESWWALTHPSLQSMAEELQAAVEKEKAQMPRPAAPLSPADTETACRYCRVRFDGVPGGYAYMTDDDTIRPGDLVRAPFGKTGQERIGQVAHVGVYTAANAPYPPERTKRLTGKAEPTPEAQGETARGKDPVFQSPTM